MTMSERIRVELEEEVSGATVTYAAEAISRRDAVDAVLELMQAEEEAFE